MTRPLTRRTRAALVGIVLAAGPASIAAADPDLVLHHAPVGVHMRPPRASKHVAASATPMPPTSDATAPSTTPGKPADATTAPEAFKPIPTTVRDLQERVMFKVNAGYELDSAPASGEPLRGGAPLAPGFTNSRSWIVGDAMVGAHDIILPSLGGYFLASYQFDTSNTVASQTALVVPGDATDQRVAIKAGYAEYQTDDKDDNHLWLRAGRQYRLDGGAMFAYFDGASAGYRSGGISVSAFGGQRVTLFVDTPQGNTFGATASFDLKKLRDLPIKLGLDYMALSIGINDGDGVIGTAESQLRQLIAASGNIDLSKAAHLDLRARVVDGGTGVEFGRIGGRLRYAASHDVMVAVDLDQRGSGDLAYDLASPTAVDVVDISRRLGVGLAAPTASTMIGAHVDWRRGNRELLIFGRANVAEGTVTNVDQESWAEGGAAIAGAPVTNVWATLQYTARTYALQNSGNIAGSAFDDTSGSGLGSLHELALDGWWKNPGAAKWRVGGGLFYRIYDYATPYVTVDHEGRGGARAELQYWLSAALHVQLGGEVAQSSPTTMREIGTMSSVRAAVEARW